MTEPQTAVLVTDADGFTGVRLSFPFAAEHPVSSGKPLLLREWVKLIPGAQWEKATRTWYIPDVTDIPRGTLRAAGFVVTHPDGSRARPSDLTDSRPAPTPVAIPSREECRLPEWFGLPLYPYQLAGAIDVVQGRRILADAPGVGKTRTSLAAASMLDVRRVLVACPPVVVTHWSRNVVECGLAAHVRDAGPGGWEIDHVPPERDIAPGTASRTCAEFPAFTSVTDTGHLAITSTSESPSLPERGVVVASSSLVAARPLLAAQLAEWRPEVFIYDEAHEAKTWTSRRSRVFRRLAQSCSVVIPVTGTPMVSSPLELAPLFALVGVLESQYGSYCEFRSRFTVKTTWGWRPNKQETQALRSFTRGIWVRRVKQEVLTELPPKERCALWVDVPLDDYRLALDEVMKAISEWLDSYREEMGEWPDDVAISAWSKSQISMVSRLRQAAGLAKVDAAVALVAEKLQADPDTPVVVWAHHKAVIAKLAEAFRANPTIGTKVQVIDGSTPEDDRSGVVDAFQAGDILVLVCSIQAAGVGITLTRSSQAVFVEADWTPALMAQAEDRQHRIGQERPVTYTTLVAAKTLDERVQQVLEQKARMIDTVMDGDHHVATAMNGRIMASDILRSLILRAIEQANQREKVPLPC